MKNISALLLLFVFFTQSFGQTPLPDQFLDGKSVVLISNAPQARPAMDWKKLAEDIHLALVDAGGDPIAYYELEDLTLSEEIQAGYAEGFNKRLVANIVILTRKANGELVLHIAPFSKNKNLISNTGMWSMQAASLELLQENLTALGKNYRTGNLLVLDVPEFPSGEGALNAGNRYLARNPLNLDVFKLGIPLAGSAGEAGLLMQFRYDLLGKSQEAILAEQNAEKSGLESIFNQHYPYQVEYLTNSKTDAELIRDRIQFVLMRVEGREGDLMKSMGIEVTDPQEKNRIVIKYYIKFLVRNELYIGPEWDADPNWRIALRRFLENLKIK